MEYNLNAVRGIAKRTMVLDAADIARYGIGEEEVTKFVGDDRMTGVESRAFRMSCGCIISEKDECGGMCRICRGELEELDQQGLLADNLTPDVLNWIATQCKAHTLRCEYPFCAMTLCPSHASVAQDGRVYCVAHFLEVNKVIDLAEIEQRRGAMAARSFGFWQSMFFDK